MLSREQREAMRARFRRLGEALQQDEHEEQTAAARLPPASRMERGLMLSRVMLVDYRRRLTDRRFADAEDERALRKADLHRAWRQKGESGG